MSDTGAIWHAPTNNKDVDTELTDDHRDRVFSSRFNDDIDASGISIQQRGQNIINDDTSLQYMDAESSDVFPWPSTSNFDEDYLLGSGPRIDDDMSSFSVIDRQEDEAYLQAVVFVEDAYRYRSINHKVAPQTLLIYRKFHSKPVILFRYFVIFLLHMLAFLEYPSSLTVTSDLRTQRERITVPCWLTQSLEFICLILLLLDIILRIHLTGCHYFIRHKWNMGAAFILVISLVDWALSCALGCQEFVRFRRILRPYFILQNSSLMKKIVNCLRRTLPEVISVLLLLGLHLYAFTLFGMLLFPVYKAKMINVTVDGVESSFASNFSISDTTTPPNEGAEYFHSLLDSLISLLVLMTTANNPDVTMPAYNHNRFASIFFILYLFIGLYCFMNILLAVIYNQFRGYFLNSMQSSLLRRRLGVRAAFEVLRRKKSNIGDGVYSGQQIISIGVRGSVIQAIVSSCHLPKHVKQVLEENLRMSEDISFSAIQFQELFCCMDRDVVHKQSPRVCWSPNPKLRVVQEIFIHKYFTYFGMVMAFVNLIIISVQLSSKYNTSFSESHSTLRIVDFTFALYYLVEQLLKLWAFGWRRYWFDKSNIYDCVITLALIIGEIVSAILFGIPYFPKSKEIVVSSSSSTMWNILRMVNILIMVRMVKVIPYVPAMSIVTTVLVDLMKNMKAFAGILVVIFYAYAILGMELFHGVIKYKPEFTNRTFECGSYEQLNYWANNFDDFFASIVVLWNIMVLNNWQVFLVVYKNKTSSWSYLYFVFWWILSVIIVLNLFTALIMENFIMKWDRRHQVVGADVSASSAYEGLTVSVHLNNVYSMFRNLLKEPAENELLMLLDAHKFLKLDR